MATRTDVEVLRKPVWTREQAEARCSLLREAGAVSATLKEETDKFLLTSEWTIGGS